jgi:MFS superfamily sulfate permease-like transporter
VVVAGEPITDIDTTGAEALVTLISDLKLMGVTFAFAELKGPVKDRLRSYGIYHRVGDRYFYSTLAHAIADYVESTDGDVSDWIDECDVDQPDADDSEGSSAGSADKV